MPCHASDCCCVEAAKAEEGKDAEVRNSVSNLKPVPYGDLCLQKHTFLTG